MSELSVQRGLGAVGEDVVMAHGELPPGGKLGLGKLPDAVMEFGYGLGVEKKRHLFAPVKVARSLGQKPVGQVAKISIKGARGSSLPD